MAELDAKRVLYVDDDAVAGMVFKHRARALGYVVEIFANGAEAVKHAVSRPAPVVVTDLRMSGLDGFGVIRAIAEVWPDTVFIITTSDPGALGSMELATHVNIAGVLTKGPDGEEVGTKLALAFDLHGKRRLKNTKSRAPNVLLVEDDATDAFLVKRMLASIPGSRCTHARTLGEGLRTLHDEAFDVIITDLALPDARGADAVHRLRAAGRDAAIVVCSGIEDEVMQRQLISLGSHECVSKNDLAARDLERVIEFARERKAFEDRMMRMAHIDPLTGVFNRAGWNTRARDAMARARRLGSRLAIAFVDLDGFKEINDRYGHDVGDAVLSDVARRLASSVREYDTVARIGGDEFAVMLSDIERHAEQPVAAARLLGVLGRPVDIPGVGSVPCAASMGLAVFPSSGDTLEVLCKAADDAMYRAKRAGKNRFMLAGLSAGGGGAAVTTVNDRVSGS